MIQQLEQVRSVGEELVWGDKVYLAGGGDVEVAIAGWNGVGENWQPRTGEV